MKKEGWGGVAAWRKRMDFSLGRAVAVLERTPRVLRSWLGGQEDGWVMGDYGPGTFSAYKVVGHLIVAERLDWIPRARIILSEGTGRPFDAFDPTSTIGPESGRPLEALLDEFAQMRRSNIDTLAAMNLTAEKLAMKGRHPALGEVTLAQLIATWAVHDLHHLRQIGKAMAHQWREQVGPWRAYLNTLE